MRRVAVILLVTVALAAAGAAWWLLLAQQMRAAVADWIAARRAEQVAVAHDGIAVGGFPDEIVLHVARPSLARATPARTAAWRGPALTVALPAWRLPWPPEEIRFALPGPQQAELVGFTPGPGLRLFAADIAGSLRPGGDRWSLDAAASDPALAPRAGDASPLRAAALRLLARAPGPPAPGLPLALDATLERLELPEDGPFGPVIGRLEIAANAAPLPEALTQEALAAWREAGGRLDLRRLAIAWGPLAGEAQGQLALDPALRPAGTLTLRIRGYDAAIDALARAGEMTPGNAAALKLAARLLAPRGPDGAIELPARLAEGWLSVGQVRLAPLPPVVAWLAAGGPVAVRPALRRSAGGGSRGCGGSGPRSSRPRPSGSRAGAAPDPPGAGRRRRAARRDC